MTTKLMNEGLTVRNCLLDGESFLLARPQTLVKGELYLYLNVQQTEEQAVAAVRFVAYTTCPAIVVVSNGSGQKVRCPRDGLLQPIMGTCLGITGADNESRHGGRLK